MNKNSIKKFAIGGEVVQNVDWCMKNKGENI